MTHRSCWADKPYQAGEMVMAWTDTQRMQVFEECWQNGSSWCPACRAIVQPDLRTLPNGYYTLTAVCPRDCGSLRMQPSDDPRRLDFRDWTPDEVAQIVSVHVAGGPPRCPVDGTVVNVTGSQTIDGNLATVLCPRCNRGQTQLYREI